MEPKIKERVIGERGHWFRVIDVDNRTVTVMHDPDCPPELRGAGHAPQTERVTLALFRQRYSTPHCPLCGAEYATTK
jgi:hypothetical protein